MNEIITKFDFAKGNWDALMDSFGEAIKKTEATSKSIFLKIFDQILEIKISPKVYSKLILAPHHVKGDMQDDGRYEYIMRASDKIRLRLLVDSSISNDEVHWVIKD
ncbi:MAG: hypothetical protein J7M11_00415 [Elusimicrobia bacterium]|nr:hypothetical protein [Elusimicrobiota bacterium]